MIGVNSVQSTSKVWVRATGSVKYSREESLWRQSHRSKSMKISNSSEFSTKESKKNRPRTHYCSKQRSRMQVLTCSGHQDEKPRYVSFHQQSPALLVIPDTERGSELRTPRVTGRSPTSARRRPRPSAAVSAQPLN